MDATLLMILRMSAAVLVYAVITGVLWHFSHKRESIGGWMKVLIGVVYGGCAVFATHFGIDYGTQVLNVRDIGPLSAGLFFSPLSGIIAGVIGGGERILAGELWNIGRFTEIACGVSTFLAGILAAILKKKVYQGKRPPVTHAFFIGAVMEVFHMYAVLFTNRDQMSYAYFVVQNCSVPMIVFTALGMVLCSVVIMKLAKEPSDLGLWTPEERTPVTVLFQRALLLVTIGLFIFNFIVSYNVQTRLTTETTWDKLHYLVQAKAAIYTENNDMERLMTHLEDQSDTEASYIMVDAKTRRIVSLPEFDVSVSAKDLELFRESAEEAEPRTMRDDRLDFWDPFDVFWIAVPVGENYFLVGMMTKDAVYQGRTDQMYESTLSDILLFTVLYMLVALLVDRLVVRNLQRVNQSLRKITGGNLKERVWVHTSEEFTELSDDINKTVTALRGYIEAAEKRMEDELKLAATIQDAALPKNFTLPAKNVELRALMTPARQVGGDFYDFFYIGAEQLCLVIADVSGKGVPASLFMMRAKTAIKNYALSGHGPSEILGKVNNVLCEGNDAEMFVTVWIGIVDLKTGRMQCANAGHEYPLIMRAGGDYELVKDKHGLVLAAMENIPLREYEIQMCPGDRLFVYTDGVPEAINEKEEQYGTDRLLLRLNRLKTATLERTLDDTLQDIRNFAGTAEQFDDITMLAFAYLDFGEEQ